MSDTAPSADAGAPTSTTAGASAAREIATLFRYEFRHFLLSVRTLLPMLIYAGFGGLAMLVLTFAANKAREQFAAGVEAGEAAGTFDAAATELLGKVLEGIGWGDVGVAAEIARDQVPLVLVIFFGLASYFLPLLVALVAFDQFSELSTRGARFALLRVRRVTYFTGKALAAFASVALFLLAMWVVVIAVTAIRGGAEVAPHAVREGLRAWALMSVLALPYLSLTALVSAFVRPGVAFVGVFGTWIALSIGSSLLQYVKLTKEGAPEEVASTLLNLFPWQHAPKLIARHGPTLVEGVAALLILAAIGYVAAAAVVRRRDV